MIVCLCYRISNKEIIKHVKDGKSFDDIQMDLGAGTNCGCCENHVRKIVENNLTKDVL